MHRRDRRQRLTEGEWYTVGARNQPSRFVSVTTAGPACMT